MDNIDKVKDLQSFIEKEALEATEKIWKDIITKNIMHYHQYINQKVLLLVEHLVLVNPSL